MGGSPDPVTDSEARQLTPSKPGERHNRHHIAVAPLARLRQRVNLADSKRLPFPASTAAGRLPCCSRNVVLHTFVGHRERQDGPQRGQCASRGRRCQTAGHERADPARHLRRRDRRHRSVAETRLHVVPPRAAPLRGAAGTAPAPPLSLRRPARRAPCLGPRDSTRSAQLIPHAGRMHAPRCVLVLMVRLVRNCAERAV
jgi:hypothetical protein